jgi:hypothetical protein
MSSDVTIKRLDDFENNHGIYYRVRAGLGVSSFGLSVENWPPEYEHYPEHDEQGQESAASPEGCTSRRAGAPWR